MTPFVPLLGLFSGLQSILSAIMQPLYWVVSGLLVGFHHLWSGVFGSASGWGWALSIITLVLVIRTALIPLFVRQINSARNMQLIQPKMKALQDKYGDDRQRLAQEQMNLYREEGVNPAASCLPLLLQSPIFLALFRVLDGASRGVPRGSWFVKHPELMTSLQDARIFSARLAGKFLPMANGFGATQWLAAFLIVGMTIVLFISQLQLMRKNMPPEALTGPMAQQQKMMLYLFPVMYLFMGISIPIGVLIYWFTTNIWTMVQQYILIHNNPSPNTPAYVDWEERMRKKGLDPDKIAAERAAKRRRNVTPAPAPVAVAVDEESGQAKPVVARQNVARQTVRRDLAGGKQVVQRQQPQRTTRSSRKK